jgi:hypothetical protein
MRIKCDGQTRFLLHDFADERDPRRSANEQDTRDLIDVEASRCDGPG